MEKVLIISGKEVKMKSTSGTGNRYREQFNRDFLTDLLDLKSKIDKGNDISAQFDSIGLYEKMAWAMAKTADDNIPDLSHWLDQFEMFAIVDVLPELNEMISANLAQINSKKKMAEAKMEEKVE